MKKLLSAFLFSLLLAVPAQAGKAFGLFVWGPFHRHNQKYMLKVAPYNAFTPYVSGRISSAGCMPQMPCFAPPTYAMPAADCCDAGDCDSGIAHEGETVTVSAPAATQPGQHVIPTGRLQDTGNTTTPTTWPMPMPRNMPVGYYGYYPTAVYPVNYMPYYWSQFGNAGWR